MSLTKNKQGLDCLAFKDRVQSEIFEQFEDLPLDEQITFCRRRAECGPLD